MAIKLAAQGVDFERMAQLLERVSVCQPKGERWTAAFDELREIVMSQIDEDDNVVSLESVSTAA